MRGLAQRIAPTMLNLRATLVICYFAPWQLGHYCDDVKWRRCMRCSAEDHARQGKNSIVQTHEMAPRIYKMPHFRTFLETSSRAIGSELAERALSTVPTDDTEGGSEESLLSRGRR